VLRRGFFLRGTSALLAAFFAYVGFHCGGRSVLFGMMLVSVFFMMAFFSQRLFMQNAGKVITAAVITEGIVALIGIGNTLLTVINGLNLHMTVLNLASSFERDEVWRERLLLMFDYPISVLIGMPAAFYVGRNGDPITFVDNLPLWLFYHTGIVGLIFFITFFATLCRKRTAYVHPQGYLIFIFFMGLVWGEGLARDTLGMYSCLPMFGAAGFLMGKTFLANLKEIPEPEPQLEEPPLVQA
jgi:hypothetical protein